VFDKKSREKSPPKKIFGTVPVELGKNVSFRDVATDTICDRRLPRSFEEITVGKVIEAVDPLSDIRTCVRRALLKDRDLGVSPAHVTDHRLRRIVVGEVALSPIVLEYLVHSINEGYEVRVVVKIGIDHAHKYAQVL
jgi:hypothetical protein